MEPVRKRVKVYQLDNNGKWDDKGTGHVACVYVESIGTMGLVVRSESDNSIILQTKLAVDDIYQKQQDSLIVWTEPESQLDLALSFQDSVGCQEIWEHIIQYQNQRQCEIDIDMPSVSIGNLQAINDYLESALPIADKDKLVNLIFQEDFIRKLLVLFEDIENSDSDKSQLFQMFNIFKNLILFNDTSILEILLSEDYLIKVMGALEYDPEISESNRIKHREFLNQQVVFKQVIKFPSKSLISTIHQTFRIQYLKDVVLPRVLDDVTFSSLNSLIYFNNIDIVSQIQNDSDFLQKLFNQIQKSEKNSNERKDLISFLQDLCNLAKGLQIQSKSTFFTIVTSIGLFKTISSILDDDSIQTRISCTDIILSSLLHDPDILRSYLCSTTSPGNSKFLVQLINLFINDKDIGVKNQIVEIIKILLEADTYESSDFFRLFYDKCIDLLVSPLNETYKGEPVVPGDPSSNLDSFVLYNIIELITYCVKHHCFRIKHFIVEEGIAKKILKFTEIENSERYLVLGSIRFFRSLVNMKDELYNQHIIQENLFEPIIQVFKSNITRYNLLNSAIIELFQYIYRENIKDLVVYLVDKYRELFESVSYTDVLKQLILKYEQIKDSSFESPEISCNNNNNNNTLNNTGNKSISISNNKIIYQRTQRELEEEEEEAYFNRDDDSEDSDDDDMSQLITNNNSNNNNNGNGSGKSICINNNNIDNNNNIIKNGTSVNGDINQTTTTTTTTTAANKKIVDYEDDEEEEDDEEDDEEINRSTEIENEKDTVLDKENTSKIQEKEDKMKVEEKEKEKENHLRPDETVFNGAQSNNNNNNNNSKDNKNLENGDESSNRKTTPKRKLDYDNESVVKKKENSDEDDINSKESPIKKINLNNNNNNHHNEEQIDSIQPSSTSSEEEDEQNMENGKQHKKIKRGKKESSNNNNNNNNSPTPSELHV